MAVEFGPYSEIISGVTAAPLPSPVRLRCYILEPEVIFQASVNLPSGAVYPISEIPFDNVVIGAYTAIKPGMTVLIGSAQGLEDYGRSYCRLDATSTVLYVGRSSKGGSHGEINAVNNAVIQVLNLYEVFAKNAFIAPDGTIYKNSNEIFSDQTSESPPISNCGPGVAGTTDPATNLLTVAFDGTNSFATADGATISSYLWDIDDGSYTVGSATTSTITATFVSGVRWISLKVTDSNGKEHTSRCPIYARFPGDDSDLLDFEITSHRITPAGQQVSVKVLSPIPADTLYDGTLVMLWSQEPATPADRTGMLGIFWLHTEPDNIAAQRTGTLKDSTLELLDVAGKLNTLPGFPQIVEYNDTPTNWTEMYKANVDRFLTYLLFWHSTALDLADWSTTGTGDAYPFVVLASDGASLWNQVEQRAKSMVPNHVLGCNTLGQITVKPDPMLLDTADRTATVQATLDESQWSIARHTHQRPARAHWLRSNAILASSSTIGTAFCIAPGTAPGQGETAMEQGEQLAISQDALNAQEGHRYARINAPESHFSITLAQGDDLDIEPANMTWVSLTLPPSVAAQRGLTFTAARGLPHSISIRYQHSRTGLTRSVELEWELETSGPPAVTVEVTPATPIDTGWTPNPTPTETTVPPPVVIAGVENIAMINNMGDIFTTADFQSSPPTWAVYQGLKATPFGLSNLIYSFVVDPFSPLYRGTGLTVRGFVAAKFSIWRIDDIFGVLDNPTATKLYTFAAATGLQDRCIAASFGRYQSAEADNPWLMVSSYYKAGGAKKGVMTISSVNAGRTWGAETTVSALVPTGSRYSNWDPKAALYLSPRTPGYAITGAFRNAGNPATSGAYVSRDWGATWDEQGNYNPCMVARNALGGCIHVPWPDNAGEGLLYYGSVELGATTAVFATQRSDISGQGWFDITPSDAGITYGPHRYQFAIRSYDNDRQIMAMAGRGNGVDLYEYGSNSKAAVFVSSDAGATWTLVDGPYAAGVNNVYPTQVAFAADDPDVILIWGNERYIAQSVAGTVENKEGNIHSIGFSGEEVVGLCGGDS